MKHTRIRCTLQHRGRYTHNRFENRHVETVWIRKMFNRGNLRESFVKRKNKVVQRCRQKKLGKNTEKETRAD